MTEQPIVHELAWDDETVQRFWSFYAKKTHLYFAEAFGAEIVRRAARWIPRGGVCIDYGCGSGGLTNALLDAGYRVGSTDLSVDAVEGVARRFAKRPGFLGAWHSSEITQAPVVPADAVLSLETIEHVTEPHLASYFATIHALLKPDGIVMVTTPNDEDIEAAKVYCPESGAVFHPMQHVRKFDARGLSALVRDFGFEPLQTFATDFGVSLRRPKQWIADKGKRLLGMGTRPPHLVAIARKQR